MIRVSEMREEDIQMGKIYITVTGTRFRFGTDFLEKGMILQLIKEPENAYDNEAIRVELKGIGQIGYVANSCKTVYGECCSAGRLYDKVGDKAEAKVCYVLSDAVICSVRKRSLSKIWPVMIDQSEQINQELFQVCPGQSNTESL